MLTALRLTPRLAWQAPGTGRDPAGACQSARSGVSAHGALRHSTGEIHDKILRQRSRQSPAWEDEAEVTGFMKVLAIERRSEWRQPPDAETVRRLHGQPQLLEINDLLVQLAGEGRTVVTLIGAENSAE